MLETDGAQHRRLYQVLFEESPRPKSLLERLHQLEDAVVEASTAETSRHGDR